MVSMSVISGAKANGSYQYDHDSNTQNIAVHCISPLDFLQISGSQFEASSVELQYLEEHVMTMQDWIREYKSNWSTECPFVMPTALPRVHRPGLAALEIDTTAKVPENSLDDPYSFTPGGRCPLRLAFGGIPLRCPSEAGEVDWVTELKQLKQAASSADATARKKAERPQLRRSNAHFKGNPHGQSRKSSKFKVDDHDILQPFLQVDQVMKAVHSLVPKAATRHSFGIKNDLSEEDILEERALRSCRYDETFECNLLAGFGERFLHRKPPGLKNWSPPIPTNKAQYMQLSSLDYGIPTYNDLPHTLPPFTPEHTRPFMGPITANTDFTPNFNGIRNQFPPSVDVHRTRFIPSIPVIRPMSNFPHGIPPLNLDEITIEMVRNLTTPDVLTWTFPNWEPLKSYYAPSQFGVYGDTQWPHKDRYEESEDTGLSCNNKDDALGASGASTVNDDWNYDATIENNVESEGFGEDNVIMDSLEDTILRRRAIRAAGTRRALSSEIEYMSCNFQDYCNQNEGELFGQCWQM